MTAVAQQSHDTEIALLKRDVGDMKDAIGEIRDSMHDISESLQKLVVLETQHAETRDGLKRAFRSLEKLESRVNAIEAELPTLKMVKSWVVGGVIGTVGIVGVGVLAMVMR